MHFMVDDPRVASDRDGFVGLYLSLYRCCTSKRQLNHRSMIEECYQQLPMVSAAVWHHF